MQNVGTILRLLHTTKANIYDQRIKKRYEKYLKDDQTYTKDKVEALQFLTTGKKNFSVIFKTETGRKNEKINSETMFNAVKEFIYDY